MSLVRCESVQKAYPGQKALDGVSLQIEAGEFVALEGVSGSGKSTLLSLIGLLDKPTAGEIFIQEQATRSMSFRRRCALRNRHFGFVFQQFHLLGDLDVLENVMLPLRYGNTPKKRWPDIAMSRLDQVGLADRYDSFPGQLSGGQQQRVAIARALVGEPALLLADEPTGNLDSHNAEQVMQLFQELNDKGMGLVMATHNEAFAARASRRLHLLDGHLSAPPPPRSC